MTASSGPQGLALLLGEIIEPLLHFVGRHFLDASRKEPRMAERIADLRTAGSVELIFGGTLGGCAGGQGALIDRIDVFDKEMNRDGWAVRTLGTEVAHFRILIGEHYGAAAELEFRVTDAAASRFGKAHRLLRAEDVLVELERLARVRDAQVWRHHVDSLGNWFCCHDDSLLCEARGASLRPCNRSHYWSALSLNHDRSR